MQRTALLQSMKKRFHRSRWKWIFIVLVLLMAWRLMVGESLSSENPLHVLSVIGALGYLYGLSPIPWQWTRDGRRLAPIFRGALQAAVWNTLWLGPVIGIVVAIFGNPVRMLGTEEGKMLLSHGHISGLSQGLVIFTHAFWASCLAGWIIAREEAQKTAQFEAEEIRRSLEATARQAQFQALQSQLDPHVLYNALSGISELIRENPAKAESAVIHLSGLYRKLTALGKRERVRLKEEREVLEDYLAVEQLRLGSRLEVSWNWPESLGNLMVPPLMIQPLVENAIKHGLSPLEEGGHLSITVTEDRDGLLLILVANSGLPLDTQWQEGTGLGNLTERLALMGGGSKLLLKQEGSRTVAEMYLRAEQVT